MDKDRDPFAYTRGPRDAKVLFVGEAWGSDEERQRQPFVGQSGRELEKMLHEAGIFSSQVLFTNVVDARPPGNDFTAFLHPNGERTVDVRGIRPRNVLRDGIDKLEHLICQTKPKLIIGAGNWPLWALTECASVATAKGYKLPSGITSWRGSQTYTRPVGGENYPYLPVLHPAGILRNWAWRSPTVHDLKARAGRFLRDQIEWDEPDWNLIPQPSFSELKEVMGGWMIELAKGEFWLSIDIETYKRKDIVVVGIADSDCAICIPFFFFDSNGTCQSYWSPEEERQIWLAIYRIMTHPNIRIIGQNFSYDTQYFMRHMGIHTPVHFDTMLAQHLVFPGTPKSLDYISSLYANYYCYWKDESQEWDAKGTHLDMWKYNCKDTRYTYDNAMELKKLIAHFKLESQYEFQLKQWQLAQAMTRRGVPIDVEERRRIQLSLFSESQRISEWLMSCMPPDIQMTPTGIPWYSSPTFLAWVLYDRLGLPVQKHKRTKKPTTDGSALEALKKKVPWLAPCFDAIDTLRSISVFNSHFIQAQLTPFDLHMRCTFNVGGTDTFRWSSNSNSFGEGTNLQNIPKGDEV